MIPANESLYKHGYPDILLRNEEILRYFSKTGNGQSPESIEPGNYPWPVELSGSKIRFDRSTMGYMATAFRKSMTSLSISMSLSA